MVAKRKTKKGAKKKSLAKKRPTKKKPANKAGGQEGLIDLDKIMAYVDAAEKKK